MSKKYRKKELYLPSEEEIKKACYEIRKNWSSVTEQSRLRADWRSPIVIKIRKKKTNADNNL